MSTEKTAAYADTRWPWHLKVTKSDGTVREDDCDGSGVTDPVGLARFLSSKPGVERVELATAFARGEQVSPFATAEVNHEH
jgi:hypothetical protein